MEKQRGGDDYFLSLIDKSFTYLVYRENLFQSILFTGSQGLKWIGILQMNSVFSDKFKLCFYNSPIEYL